MKNTKMIFIYGNYGNKLVHVAKANNDSLGIDNAKGNLTLTWHYSIGDRSFIQWRRLNADESFTVFNYDEKMFTDAEKEIEERR